MTVTQLLQFSIVSIVDNEVPAGAVDGKNTTFTLANTPNPPSSLHVHVNGLLLHAGVEVNGLSLNAGADFALAGAQIQMT